MTLGAITEWATRVKAFAVPFDEVRRRAVNLPRAAYGMLFAHAGVGIVVIGIAATTAWHTEAVQVLAPGSKLTLSGYDITFAGAYPGRGPNYQETVGRFDVSRNGRSVTELLPSKRIFDAPRQSTTQAAISTSSLAIANQTASSWCGLISIP